MKISHRLSGINHFRLGVGYSWNTYFVNDRGGNFTQNFSLYLGSLTVDLLHKSKKSRPTTLGFPRHGSSMWALGYYGIPGYFRSGKKFHRFDIFAGKQARSISNHERTNLVLNKWRKS